MTTYNEMVQPTNYTELELNLVKLITKKKKKTVPPTN